MGREYHPIRRRPAGYAGLRLLRWSDSRGHGFGRSLLLHAAFRPTLPRFCLMQRISLCNVSVLLKTKYLNAR